jgi:hypothetical protein
MEPAVSRPYYIRIVLASLAVAALTGYFIVAAPRRIDDVRVIHFEPSGGDVALDAPIRVTFSRPVEPLSAERSFLIFPIVPGRLSWEDAQTFRFEPNEPYQPRTSYRIIIRSGLRDADGNRNIGETSWTFLTR